MTSSGRTMIGILVVATAMRVWGLGFGLPFGNARPDEIQIAGSAVGYLSGDLRPPFFQWPALFQYLVAVLYLGYAVLGRPWTGFASVSAFVESRRYAFNPFLYMPRMLSAAFGVATVWAVFALGRRAFDATTGCVAAVFLSPAFLHVRESHFGVTDTPMTFLLPLTGLAGLERPGPSFERYARR